MKNDRPGTILEGMDDDDDSEEDEPPIRMSKKELKKLRRASEKNMARQSEKKKDKPALPDLNMKKGPKKFEMKKQPA